MLNSNTSLAQTPSITFQPINMAPFMMGHCLSLGSPQKWNLVMDKELHSSGFFVLFCVHGCVFGGVWGGR